MNLKTLILAATAFISSAAQADDIFMDAHFKYRIADETNHKVYVTGLSAGERPETLFIPSKATYLNRTYTVVGIGTDAFADLTSLTSVWLPESIRYIGEGAFSGCQLKEIHCHATVPPKFSPVEIEGGRNVEEMRLRDPFIFADTTQYIYYTFMPRWVNDNPGVEKYESYDMRRWKSTGWAWDHVDGFLGNNDCWAPDMYEWKGDHYIFITFSRVYDRSNGDHWNRDNFEIKPGTTLLKSPDGPGGKYYPMFTAESGRLNYTPSDMFAIDGSLYVDTDGQPWMIYSGELCQFYDGRVYAQKMKPDFTDLEGEPILLFSASQSRWAHDSGVHEGHRVYITDAPFIYRDKVSGKLIMIWSSNSNTGYAVGGAVSESGKVTGPWRHTGKLNTDNGGHAMLFHDLEGRLMMSYHTTENGTAIEHMCIRQATVSGGEIKPFDMENGYMVKSGDEVNPSFNAATLATAKVYLPRAVYMDYRLGSLWTAFSNLALEQSGIDDVADDSEVPYRLEGCRLTVAPGCGDTSVYSISGTLMARFGNDGGEMSFNQRGIYLLKTATKNYKLTI